MKHLLIVALTIATAARVGHAQVDGYYVERPQFHYYPDPNLPRQDIGRLGPIGLALELRKPNFTMYIKSVEEGSPAASTGKLRPMQIITSINGEVLKDIDPRVQLGNMITKIEATDGVVRLMIKDEPDAQAYPVEFNIPVMGAYSATWPMNCAKSDRIVREMADWLRKQENWGWGAALFMLSTGEQKDLDEVGKRYHARYGEGFDQTHMGHTWSIGYTGIAHCEYYLRTGDKVVLPAIKAMCNELRDTMYNGSWMGSGGVNYKYMGGGHLNAAGVHANTFMLLAKECGVDVDQRTFEEGFRHIFRYAGRGIVAYGDQLPETGMTDNGKVAKLAFTMAAAANLSPKGEDSIYAKARDICATKSFYTTSWLFHGHTGGGIGELWRGPAMGLVKDKRPEAYRTFMDERRWMYELARTHEGTFGWADGQNVSYTRINSGSHPNGNYIPLIYTLPRKKLRIFGAPATKYSQTYELPDRPWGTAADDVFYSMTPGEYAPGKRLDLSLERLKIHASMPIFQMLGRPDVTDEELLAYAYHIDHGIRAAAAGEMAKRGRADLILQLLKSDDPRARRAGLQGLTGHGKNGALPVELRTDEMFELAGTMITDPEESWWVVEAALRVLAMGRPDQITPHVDRLAYWLGHEEWWLYAAAVRAIVPIATDIRYSKRFFPIIGVMLANNTRVGPLTAVRDLMKQVITPSDKP
ncbi:MAG: hypothetical protein GC164_15525 [Phycisphaera sp.]|nr:hypothetical protein [Phycisphaera sp.]